MSHRLWLGWYRFKNRFLRVKGCELRTDMIVTWMSHECHMNKSKVAVITLAMRLRINNRFLHRRNLRHLNRQNLRFLFLFHFHRFSTDSTFCSYQNQNQVCLHLRHHPHPKMPLRNVFISNAMQGSTGRGRPCPDENCTYSPSGEIDLEPVNFLFFFSQSRPIFTGFLAR